MVFTRREKVARIRGHILVYVFLIALSAFTSVATLLIKPQTASAISQDDSIYCINNFPAGGVFGVTKDMPAKNDFNSHNCGEICKIGQKETNVSYNTGSQGLKADYVESCTAAKDPVAEQSDAIERAYASAVADAVCSKAGYTINGKLMEADYSDCRSSAATATTECLTVTNGSADIDTTSAAICIKSKNISASQKAIADTLSRAKTKAKKAGDDAKSAAITANQKVCEGTSGVWDSKTNSCTSAEQKCNTDGGAWNAATKTCSTGSQSSTTCSPEIGGLGWVVCPVVNLVAELNDKMQEQIDYLLEFNTADLANAKSGTYTAWSIFRNYANIAFILVFLIVIFSQVSSIGISNYGIKRILPRLIITAILINLSFFLCQLMADVSNLSGYGLKNTFESIIESINKSNTGASISTAKEYAGKALAGVALIGLGGVGIAAGGGVLGTLALLLPILLSSLVALAMVLLILVARQALIVLLISIAPLAFIAYVLPNTEQWFKRWWKTFYTLLLLFPIVSTVFGASKVAATIINLLGGAWSIVALGIIAIPAFVIPGLLKGALNATGSIGAKLLSAGSRIGKGSNSFAKKRGENSRFGEAVRAAQSKKMDRRINRRIGKGVFGKINTRLDNSSFGRRIGGDRGAAAAIAAQQKATREQIDNKVALLEHEDAAIKLDKAKEALTKANETGDVVSARAAAQVLRNGGTKGRDMLHDGIIDLEKQPGGMDHSIAEGIKADNLTAGVKSYDAALDSWSTDRAGNSLDDLSTSSVIKSSDGKLVSNPSASRLNQNEVGSQSAARLKNYAENGLLSYTTAKAALSSYEKGTLALDDNKVKILQDYIEKNPPSEPQQNTPQAQPTTAQNQQQHPQSAPNSPSTPNTTTHLGQTFDQGENGLYIPRSR